MATLIREFVLNADDSVNIESLKILRETVGDINCGYITKSGKVCNKKYIIHPFGFCGCQYHENYSHALQALSKLEESDDDFDERDLAGSVLPTPTDSD